MTRNDLADAIVKEHGLSGMHARRIVDQIVQQMTTALVQGENVKIANFGVFEIRRKAARVGRNPATLEPHTVTARNVLMFRATERMSNRIGTRDHGGR